MKASLLSKKKIKDWPIICIVDPNIYKTKKKKKQKKLNKTWREKIKVFPVYPKTQNLTFIN